MEILDYRVVLPAFVKIRDVVQVASQSTYEVREETREYNVFVYIDHSNKDVMLVDTDGWLGDRGELRKAIYAHIMAQRRPAFVPPSPSEGFTKLKPETYMKNDQM